MNDDDEAELLAIAGRVRDVETRLDDFDTAAQHILNAQTQTRIIHWPDLDPERAQAKWTAFLVWVQDVFCVRYPTEAAKVRACWWQHLDVVDYLTAIWMIWEAAYRLPKATPMEVGNWQRTYLPDLIVKIEAALTNCDQGHDPSVARSEAMRTAPITIT